MPDDEKVKAALDDFENEKFADAKDKLADVVKSKRDEFLKKELKLQKDISPKEEEPEGDEEEKEEEPEGDEEEPEDKDEKKKMRKRVAKAIKKKQKEED